MIDLWDLATWTALWKTSSVKWSKRPLRLKFTLCVSTNIVLFSIAGPLAGLRWSKIPGRWLDLLYCCSIVQHKYYLSLPLQQGRFQSRATNTWQEIFPRGVRGEPLTSLPLIRKPASGTRASNGGRKISTKTVRKKRLLVIVLSWNLAW